MSGFRALGFFSFRALGLYVGCFSFIPLGISGCCSIRLQALRVSGLGDFRVLGLSAFWALGL